MDGIAQQLQAVRGYPDYHNDVAGNIKRYLATDQLVAEEHRYPLLVVNEVTVVADDGNRNTVGDGTAHYHFDMTVQVAGIHVVNQALSLRADIIKAVPLTAFNRPSMQCTLLDMGVFYQETNSDYLVVFVNYSVKYARSVGRKV